jgi:hypothetical protein
MSEVEQGSDSMVCSSDAAKPLLLVSLTLLLRQRQGRRVLLKCRYGVGRGE